MTNEITLALVENRARHLASQHLRSGAVAVARMRELIEMAHRIGHSHGAIHAALVSGGLVIAWNNYRVALARARKAKRTFGPEDGEPEAATATGRSIAECPPQPQPQPQPRDEDMSAVESASSPSATPVLEALRRARETASRDYARMAQDSHRKEPRP